MLRRLLLASALLLLPVEAATADEATVSEFLAKYDDGVEDDRFWATLAIGGITDGYGWANTTLAIRKVRPLYCSPPSLSITPEQSIDILRRFASKHQESSAMPYGMALLIGLIETFPCR